MPQPKKPQKKRGRPAGVKNGQGQPKREGPPGTPGRKLFTLDEKQYGLIAALAQAGSSQEEMADYLGVVRETFRQLIKRDPQLEHLFTQNVAKGKTSVRRAQLQKALDRYMTICKDCHKIHMGEFLPSCPYCDELEPEDEEGNDLRGTHTNVTHKFVPGDTGMLIWLGKNWLGQSDKIVHQGDADNPLELNVVVETPAQRLARYKKYFEEMDAEKRTGAATKDDCQPEESTPSDLRSEADLPPGNNPG